MSSTKKIMVFASILCLFAWGRVLWVWFMYLPPAEQMEYVVSNDVTLPGYPHGEPPFLIDGNLVWQFTSYDTDHKRKGFVCYNFEDKKARMLWALPEEKDFISIMGAVKSTDGRLAVMYEVGEKAKIAILTPEGKIEIIECPSPSITVRGWSWVGDHLEVATSINNVPVSALYRYDAEGWKKHIVRWPITDLSHKYATALFAFYRSGEWKFLVSICTETQFQSGKPITYEMFYLDTRNKLTLLHSIVEDASFMYSKVDTTPGNMLSRVYGEKYYLENDKIVPFSSGVEGIDKVCQPKIFLISPTRLKRIVEWGKEYHQTEFFDYPSGRYEFSYAQSSLVVGNQQTLFLGIQGQSTKSPLAGEYRFGVNHTLVPLKDGFGILGAFGYYITINKQLERTSSFYLWKRIIQTSKQFFSRNIYYDDFLWEYRYLKSLAVPIILLFLPLFLFMALIFKKELFIKTVCSIYIFSFGTLFFWFWRISFFM